jgi:hypothetical protein
LVAPHQADRLPALFLEGEDLDGFIRAIDRRLYGAILRECARHCE